MDSAGDTTWLEIGYGVVILAPVLFPLAMYGIVRRYVPEPVYPPERVPVALRWSFGAIPISSLAGFLVALVALRPTGTLLACRSSSSPPSA